MALTMTFILSLTFLVGILVIRVSDHKETVEHISILLAFGAMVAIALLDLVPEIAEQSEGYGILLNAFFVAVGIFCLKLLDHFIPEHEGTEESEEGNLVHIGVMSAIAIVLHNIVEGMSVYSVAATSLSSGISLAFGVGLHNIPMGMFIYSTIIHEKMGRKVLIIMMTAFSTLLGGLLMASLAPFFGETVVGALMSVALGMVVYILFFELYPSLKHGKGIVLSGLWIVLGFLIVMMSMLFE